ncbi:MAG: hypothetical protein KBE09_04070 [Candidatus Pacebacteria bacterium]|nr:hypothetical protein [Candidatus Paceibacterota bacterium]
MADLTVVLNTHQPTCTPQKPCAHCHITAFLQKKLRYDGLRKLQDLLSALDTASLTHESNEQYVAQMLAARWEEALLNLSVRAANCLKNAGLVTVADIAERTEEEMLRTPHFSRKTLNELKEILASKGLHFGRPK